MVEGGPARIEAWAEASMRLAGARDRESESSAGALFTKSTGFG